ELYWTTVKNILNYLRNTKDMFLVYGDDMKRELRVACYTDVGYLMDADDLRSQTGYVFILNGGAVDWKSTKQSIFTTSSTDVEYIAAFDASKEAVWIRKFFSELGVVPTIEEPINMYCDNTRAIAIAKDHGVTKGARHFRVKVHYLRETIKKISTTTMEEHIRRERKIKRYYEADSKRKKEYGKTVATYNKEQVRCVLDLMLRGERVWDHMSGKLKKDLQYQAEVSTRRSGKSCNHLDYWK
ncbi:hypothetical protein Tco_0986463, partial [Tanacetum coccineum]